MNFHQSFSISKIAFRIFSSLVHHFYSSLFRSVSTIGWCFSSSFSDFEDRRRVPLKSLPVLPKMRSSSLMPSSHNCFRLWEFFSTIQHISGVASFLDNPNAIISEYYSFSTFEDRRRISLKSCSILFKMRSSSLMPSSHNCFQLWKFFSTIRRISWVVSISFLRRPSCHNSSFSACSYLSPNLTGESFK